ncbi:alpha/beta fold hydrolase [Ilumatobacter sp.]|uniref:alpha/beta fold hydrolase n=1 Tax=Ilumatobacter sp. TaxID=1967498 RepID=UPI003C3BB8AA
MQSASVIIGETSIEHPREVSKRPVVEQFELDRGDVRLSGDVIGTGPTILLLHAGGERRSVWTPITVRLAAAGYRCVTFDLRGHGNSQGTRDVFWPIVDDAVAMINSIGQRCVVVGSSLGGIAAIGAMSVETVQTRIRGLVLVDVVPDPSPSFARRFLEREGVLARATGLVDDVLAHGTDLAGVLAQFRQPILLVRASDSAVTDHDVDRLRRRVPQTEVVNVDSGHLIARDAPFALACVLTSVLDEWHNADTTAHLNSSVRSSNVEQ